KLHFTCPTALQALPQACPPAEHFDGRSGIRPEFSSTMIGIPLLAKEAIGCVSLRLFTLLIVCRRRPNSIAIFVGCCTAIVQTPFALGDVRSTSARHDAVQQTSHPATKRTTDRFRAPAQFANGEWPFRPLVRPAMPDHTQHGDRMDNPIDVFVNEKLEV